MVNILIANLHEHAPCITEQLPHEIQPAPKVRQVRMNPKLPRITECAYHLRLCGQIVVAPVLDITFADKGLEV